MASLPRQAESERQILRLPFDVRIMLNLPPGALSSPLGGRNCWLWEQNSSGRGGWGPRSGGAGAPQAREPITLRWSPSLFSLRRAGFQPA